MARHTFYNMAHVLAQDIYELALKQAAADNDRLVAATPEEFYNKNGPESIEYLLKMSEPRLDWVEYLLQYDMYLKTSYVKLVLDMNREDIAVMLMTAIVNDAKSSYKIAAKLIDVVKIGNIVIVKVIIDMINDSGIEDKDDYIDDAIQDGLTISVKNNHVDIVNILLDTWLNMEDDSIISELVCNDLMYDAIMYKHVDVVKALIEWVESNAYDDVEEVWDDWWENAQATNNSEIIDVVRCHDPNPPPKKKKRSRM